MNISDRARLYREIRRVLKPGGKFATFDVVSNSEADPRIRSHQRERGHEPLLTPAATHDAIEVGRFPHAHLPRRHRGWQNLAAQLRAAWPPPSPDLGIVKGPDFAPLAMNLGPNLIEGRVGIITAVFEAMPT